MSDRSVGPQADELEVSVFGPGRGECIVVHVPDGPWFVVDSFLVGGEPVAKLYLDLLGVAGLDSMFVTHWHEDHSKGAAALVSAFSGSLRLVGLPGAMNSREYASWTMALLPNATAFAPVRDLMAVVSALENAPGVHKVLLSDLQVLSPHNAGWTLTALSPNADDVLHQLTSLAEFLPGFVGPLPPKPDVNSGASVLVLEAAGMGVVLSSDLDIGRTPTMGWQHIVAKHAARLGCIILKVGHHGSRTSYHPPALQHMPTASGPPHGAVTPYPGKNPLPRRAEVTKYKQHLAALHVSASKRAQATKAGKTPLSDLKLFSSYMKTSEKKLAATGQVRYRIRAGEQQPRVALFGPAEKL